MSAFPSGWRHPGEAGQLAALLARPVAWRGGPLATFTRILAGTLGDTVFSRASKAWLDGLGLTEYADDMPRFDAAGMLVMEEQRTNTIRNPRGEGAAAGVFPDNWQLAGSQNGVFRTCPGGGTMLGLSSTFVRFAGTATGTVNYTATFEAPSSTTVTSGDTHALSAFLRLAAGSLSGFSDLRLAITYYNSSNAVVGNFSASLSSTLSGVAQRFACVGTAPATATYARIGLQPIVSSGETVDATIEVCAPQFELGGFATTPILPPAGSQFETTRAQDRARVPLAARGGIGFRFSVPVLPQGTDQTIIFQADQGSESQDRIVVMLHASGALVCYVIIGTSWNYVGLGNVVPGQLYAVALTISDGEVRGKLSGGAESGWSGVVPPVNMGRIFNRSDNFFARTGRFGPLDLWTPGATTDQILAALP